MPDPKRRRKHLLVVAAFATISVAGPVVTVVFCLGGITSFASLMDLHGFTATMRVMVVGAVAVVITPFAVWICAKRRDLPGEHADKAELAALRYGNHSASPRGRK